MQAGPAIPSVAATAPATPPIFHPIRLSMKMKFGPGMICDSAKKSANSRSPTQALAVTTRSRISGNTTGMPPKLISDSSERCAARTRAGGEPVTALSAGSETERQC